MNNSTAKQITITVDQDVEYNIGHAMRIIEEQKQLAPHSEQWQRLEEQMDQIYHDIGFSVVYDYRQLPF